MTGASGVGEPLQQLLDWPTDVWIQSGLEARSDLCGFKSFVAASQWQLLTTMTTSKSSNGISGNGTWKM